MPYVACMKSVISQVSLYDLSTKSRIIWSSTALRQLSFYFLLDARLETLLAGGEHIY